jgi:AcrR family transcriptional regulator
MTVAAKPEDSPPARVAASRRKEPRRTAERILEVTLTLFNRFGEPNVSTTLISNELRISPGNLYYHYPAKDELVNALFDRFETDMVRVLGAAEGVAHVEDAWFLFHTLFERIWDCRFLYRDLNDLLSRNRKLETHFQDLLKLKQKAVRQVLEGLSRSGSVALDPVDAETVATSMVVVLTHWLSYEYECNPRQALEPGETSAASLMRGAYHVLSLLSPYLAPEDKAHLRALAGAYIDPAIALD